MRKIYVWLLFVCLTVTAACLIPVKGQESFKEMPEPSETVVRGNRITRLLVLGCDRAAHLTDSILLLTVEEPSAVVHILQIPRDTYAAYTDRDYKKLNGACSVLGLNGIKTFLSGALGVKIDYVLSLDLDCVSGLVDAVGGVDLEVKQEMRYSDTAQGLEIALEPGMQHLNGTETEHFLRFRSGYANADLGRMDAQKQFLQAFAEKCKTLESPALMRMLWVILPRTQTDLPLPDAIRLIHLFPQADVTNIPMMTAPGEAVQGNSGAWYYCLNRAGMIEAVNRFMLPENPITDAEFDPEHVFDRQEHPDFHRIYTAPASKVLCGIT